MTKPLLTTSNFLLMAFLMLLLLILTEPALALNVEKIGKGVVGDQRVKMSKIKAYMTYFGGFFIILGIITTVFRKHKFALQKRSDTHAAMGPFVIFIGIVLVVIGLI